MTTNIHRQLAQQYSAIAFNVASNSMPYLLRVLKDKYNYSTATRWRVRKLLRHEKLRVIAYAEQVEHHLNDALEYEQKIN